MKQGETYMRYIKNQNVVWGMLIAILALFVNPVIAQTEGQEPAPCELEESPRRQGSN